MSSSANTPMWLEMAVSLAKQFEGCVLTAYADPARGWALPTIGYGATGAGIVRGTVWTQAQADADLSARMSALGAQITALKSGLTDTQLGALCDFAYNLGIGALRASTLMRCVAGGDIQGAADQFPLWIKAAGVVLPGLVKRREAERALFLSGA